VLSSLKKMEHVKQALLKVHQPPEDYLISVVGAVENATAPVLGKIETSVRQALASGFQPQLSMFDEFVEQHTSKLASRLPLMNPFNVLLVVLIYLIGVVFIGKLVMSVLPRWNARPLAILHNLILVTLSGYMAVSIGLEAHNQGYSFWGNAVDDTERGWPMAKLIWLFTFSKILEFMDTLIMILKKNFRQVSFLHVYHHSTIFAIWWLVTLMAPSGDCQKYIVRAFFLTYL